MSITKVQLFSIPVSDQDRARDFYTGVLGMELVREMPMGPGMRWVQVRPKGADTSITLVTWFPSMPAGSVTGVVLETDDLDAEVARLKGLGVEPEEPVREQAWGRSVTIVDPDGNRLVIQATTAS
jgi:catechol 2,3-dioxygenase-like lactoylglutathione lyase family enzyme